MSALTDKSLQTLELPRVLDMLAAFAVSEEAKERCLALRPASDIEEAAERQKQTGAARAMLEQRGAPALSGIKPVAAALSRAQLGGILNTRELLDIAATLRAARTVRAYASADRGLKAEPSSLDNLFRRLAGDKPLEDHITGCILSEEEISDHASSELASIRRKIRATGSKIRDTLNKYISSHGKYLQDALITQRGGRFVIPVKAEHKNDVPGLLHDVSSSGATLFIEPAAVVQADNELRELEGKERKEIERILAILTAECDASGGLILEDYDALVAIDAIFARAKLASDMNASQPLLGGGGVTDLRMARHPLLPKGTAVPVSVWLGKGYDTLVVTGPNTGGKTVTLKTLGLLTLMAACGLHIPAGEGSEVAFTGAVYADIGDEQSIAQSLSTFSSHMRNIVAILGEAGPGSLVLFDELGAGTDPVEGAALAVAIIEQARSQSCHVAATTHYAELKTYAMSTAGVENASCEFDVETLRPTFRLLIGIPGRSNAFAISQRLGLPGHVIEAARQRVGVRDAAFEDILSKLERQRTALENDRAEAERALRQSEEDRRKSEELRGQIEREHEKAADSARAEARRILNEARQAAEEAARNIARAREAASSEELAEARRKINKAEDSLGGNLPLPEPEELFDKPPAPGSEVLLAATGTRAVVLDEADKNGMIPLQAGIMKITAPLSELRPCTPKKEKKLKGGSVSVARAPEPIQLEIDLRGQPADDGVLLMERFIDDAVMRKLETVTVIHGKGTGALRAAVHAALKKNRSVKGFRLGKYGEGETGVTVVTLR
ncbi:MAG: endonuclease MutS2 [Oscillospiraceae bacterium]|jgi:DNA mismatch repair protein MutS2|nr:endonuclease MutS2 [Oscillospiraceae bacterium]